MTVRQPDLLFFELLILMLYSKFFFPYVRLLARAKVPHETLYICKAMDIVER